VSVAEQIRAIAGLRHAETASAAPAGQGDAEAASAAPAEDADAADMQARLARIEAESGIPVAAFAALAEIVTLLLSEEDMP
jgi:hypothetical protein